MFIPLTHILNVEEEEHNIILNGLTRGMSYTFIVHAFIDIPSAASSPASILFDGMIHSIIIIISTKLLFLMYYSVPSQVLSLYANSFSRTITWIPPEGSIEITMYQLQYTPLCSSGTVLISTTSTSVVLSGTDPSIPYNITVHAANNIGPGQQKSIIVKRIYTASKIHFDQICAIF